MSDEAATPDAFNGGPPISPAEPGPRDAGPDAVNSSATDIVGAAELRRRSRRSVVTGMLGLGAGVAGWRWMLGRPLADRVPGPFRAGLEWNEALWSRLGDPDRRVPTFDESDLTGIPVNGRQGLESPLNRSNWRMRIEGPDGDLLAEIDEDELASLERVDQIVEHKCIEGWSAVVRWTGPVFSTLVAHVGNVLPDDWDNVGFETPDRVYYVGLGRDAAMHSQTVLATHLDGEPLTEDHGAPVRLAVPIAYGIKSIKRIGTVRFTRTRQPDFWAERGYDWYSLH